ncbi:MAG: lysozyme inhibitor LprI family protein [Pseudomonadota bacterium]
MHAKSTADNQACLKRHLESAQKRLNDIYTKLTDTLEGEALETLQVLQKSWLDYRDKECGWEMSLSESPALKRADELSCIARITEDRADILTVALEGKEEDASPREYGSFPRWMNVAADANTNIAWHYGARRAIDLNCDGQDEYVMAGFSLKENTDKETKALAHIPQYHVAIASSPAIGKPDVRLLSFDVQPYSDEKIQEEEKEASRDSVLCSINAKLNFTQGEPFSEDNPDEICSAQLILDDKACGKKIFFWNGSDYILEKEAENGEKSDSEAN